MAFETPITESTVTVSIFDAAIDAAIAASAAGALVSPGFTGTPTAPTAPAGTNTAQIATTAFVQTLAGSYATLASPALTGTPTAPTAPAGTNTAQIATTAFANAAALAGAASLTPVGSWDASAGTFPASTAIGDYYIVSTAGLVDSEYFQVGDWLISATADASTTDFSEWLRAPYGSASGGVPFASRSALVSARAAGFFGAPGEIVSDGTLQYLWMPAGHVAYDTDPIADLPGLAPFGDIYVDHFGRNASPGTTDMSASAQAAVDYVEANYSRGANIYFGPYVYVIEGLRIKKSGVSLEGQSRNSTVIRNNSRTVSTIHFEPEDSLTGIISRVHVRDMYMVNESTDPTTSCHIKAVRTQIEVDSCQITDAFRAFEFHGTLQGSKILSTKVVQGSNTTVLQNASCALALLRAQLATPLTVSSGQAYSDPPAPGAVGDVWDASAGAFPSGASNGDTFRVSVAGTMDGVTFAAGDYLQAVTGSPSTTTYAANWERTAVAGYYVEPNVTQIDNCDFEANLNGMDTVIFITCSDGLEVSNSHLGFGVNSIVEFAPIQQVIDNQAFKFSNVFFDPRTGETERCIWIRDRYGVGTATLASISVTTSMFGSPDYYGIQVGFDCDQLVVDGNFFQGCGRSAVLITDASVNAPLITNNTMRNTNTSGGTYAAIDITEGNDGVIDGNTILSGYSGIKIGANVTDTVIGESNVIDGMTSGNSIVAAAGASHSVQFPNRCIVKESNSVASAATIALPIGLSAFTITGTTTIGGIQTTSPNSSVDGRTVTLTFSSACIVEHAASPSAGDIVLAPGGDFKSAAGDTLTLENRSGVWYEAGRSSQRSNSTVFFQSVADDSAVSIPLPGKHGFVRVTSESTPDAWAIIHYRATDGAEVAHDIASGNQTTVTTGVLSGTDGADVEVTISIDDETLYIENRLGPSLNFWVSFE